ncbi:MAG: hypothetical protein WEE89_21300 [Gemmatimonadota bacterium]
MTAFLRYGRCPRSGPKEVETIGHYSFRWAQPSPRTGGILHAREERTASARRGKDYLYDVRRIMQKEET